MSSASNRPQIGEYRFHELLTNPIVNRILSDSYKMTEPGLVFEIEIIHVDIKQFIEPIYHATSGPYAYQGKSPLPDMLYHKPKISAVDRFIAFLVFSGYYVERRYKAIYIKGRSNELFNFDAREWT